MVKNFSLDLINNTILLIILPEKYNVEDLLDMKVKDDEISLIIDDNDIKNPIILNNFEEEVGKFIKHRKKIKNAKIYIINSEELKKRKKGISLLYEDD